MIAALLLTLQLHAAPPMVPPPSRLVRLSVGSHTTLVFRGKNIRGWTALQYGVFKITLARTDPDHKRTRISIEAIAPGLASIDFVCGAKGHEVWLVKVI